MRIDRKQFLKWTLSSGSALALGCSGDVDTVRHTGGAGGTSTAGGGAGGSTFPSSGTGGTTTAGAAGNGGQTTAGSGGSSAGSAGTGGSMPLPPNCSTQLTVAITADHGHVLAITIEDVMAGVDKVYDTTGTSMHPHWIQMTAADFAKLQAGDMVRKLTCNDGHEHEFIINCTAVTAPTTTPSIVALCDPEHMCAGTNTNFCPELPDMP